MSGHDTEWWAEPSANFATLVLYKDRFADGAYDVDLAKEEFDRLLERAARHAGYSARQRDFKAYYDGEIVLEHAHWVNPKPDPPKNPCPRHSVSVTRRKLVGYRELPGAPIVACLFAKDELPITAYSCGTKPNDVRYVNQLVLRAHERANLLFEVHRSVSGPSWRTVSVEIELPATPELRRIVENTVHIVMLGARPRSTLQTSGFDSRRSQAQVVDGAVSNKIWLGRSAKQSTNAPKKKRRNKLAPSPESGDPSVNPW